LKRKEDNMGKLLYTVPEAARILGIGKNKMYEVVNAGAINVLRLGSLKIPKEELDRFIKANINMDLNDLSNITPIR
jgi:excisionase family DNA binding protein